MRWWKWRTSKRPTLLLRCILLIAAELAVNALLWLVAAIVFRHRIRFLTLSLLAWTLGLRHALDADHISVIDNATRRIVSLNHDSKTCDKRQARPRRPVTCGLWFSLGHSTIVVAVICAIAISLGIVDRLGKVSSVGGLIGASVSGSTLFLFAVVNSILLYQSVKATRKYNAQTKAEVSQRSPNNHGDAVKLDKIKTSHVSSDKEANSDSDQVKDHRFRGIFTRLAYPLFRLVDRPYKLYPIGLLFGLGFDTASSIALLGIAGATNTEVKHTGLESDQAILPGNATTRSDASIVLLALLFTAGMTLVDSLDSVLMVNAYAPGELLAPAEQSTEQGRKRMPLPWLRQMRFLQDSHAGSKVLQTLPYSNADVLKAPLGEEKWKADVVSPAAEAQELRLVNKREDNMEDEHDRVEVSRSTCTSLSHLLTLLSIVLAFAISIITLVGLIGENCDRCARAAAKQDETYDGGLEGQWWLFWQKANDASGIIGACILGGFAAVLLIWYVGKAALKRCRRL
ncbi:hypothetical protein NDA18_001497 [Ustilago nuda]|nr:hypothetical protein NDA18_001497 [Ustilago nuda]